jgi:ABC-type bacteriocin/lantibiotic exporter with double-glycine peptidase domain
LLRALIGKHRLLLLEEPFNYLDNAQKNSVLQYLRKDNIATIIITSKKEIMNDCDVIIRLKNGEIQ